MGKSSRLTALQTLLGCKIIYTPQESFTLYEDEAYKLNHYDDILSLLELYKSIILTYKRTEGTFNETLDALRQLQEKNDMTENEKKLMSEKIKNLIEGNNKQRNIIKKKEKLISMKNQQIEELIPKATRAEEMTRKKSTSEELKPLSDILSIQKELVEDLGMGHQSSLSKAIKVYNVRNKKYWGKNKMHSIQSDIGYHIKKGNLPK